LEGFENTGQEDHFKGSQPGEVLENPSFEQVVPDVLLGCAPASTGLDDQERQAGKTVKYEIGAQVAASQLCKAQFELVVVQGIAAFFYRHQGADVANRTLLQGGILGLLGDHFLDFELTLHSDLLKLLRIYLISEKKTEDHVREEHDLSKVLEVDRRASLQGYPRICDHIKIKNKRVKDDGSYEDCPRHGGAVSWHHDVIYHKFVDSLGPCGLFLLNLQHTPSEIAFRNLRCFAKPQNSEHNSKAFPICDGSFAQK
jgi:hypothetical protein